MYMCECLMLEEADGAEIAKDLKWLKRTALSGPPTVTTGPVL